MFEMLKKSPYFTELVTNQLKDRTFEFTCIKEENVEEQGAIIITSFSEDVLWYFIRGNSGKILCDIGPKSPNKEEMADWFRELLEKAEEENKKRLRLRKLFQ